MKTVLNIFLFLLFSNQLIAQEKNYSVYVDPFIGTGGHGHAFPGATVPFGMVQLSPDTRIDGSWDGCSGYHYSDSIIYGFSHTHLSGTGCSDYGDIMLMPLMSNSSCFYRETYSSKFSHKTETVSPGYYSVKLEDDNISVELTATTRVGMHKYTFSEDGEADIIMDLNHRDKLLQGDVKMIDDKTIEVFRRSEAWAKDQYIYARIEFSKKMNDKPSMQADVWDFTFDIKKGESLLVKVALSTTSAEGARKNLQTELPGWDFEKTKTDAEALWNNELGKIEITTPAKDKLKVFYTSLYHTMIQPNVAMDVDGSYRGRDNKIHKAEGFTYYSVFSLWDTFRAAHPLYTIIDQKRTSDFINTFLAQYDQGGRLPVWELASNETDCMIGYHSVSVIADAMVKGIKGFGYEKAFEASKHSAMLDHLGLKAYKQNGFISMDDESESVSKTLEYAYDDWCIAQMALLLKKENDYHYFMKRSQSWKNVFDPETGFMRPKKNGGWLTPFDPREVNNNYTEGNAWQYTFFVPQDMEGLIKMMGGNEKFEKKLDELFTSSNKTTGREQADITGLIGQYAHGNEPSHHMAYLYDYVGKSSKTQERIHQILTEFYKPSPDGLIGNEDCGQMSAWYVLSSMGFYQVTPGTDVYKIGAPLFDNVKIHLESGKEFSIETKNSSSKNIYIDYGTLDKIDLNQLAHSSIFEGRKLSFEMSDKPNNNWNKPSLIRAPSYPFKNILPVPIINTNSKVFDDSMLVEIKSQSKAYFAVLNSGQSAPVFHPYTKPFYISTSKNIFAYSDDGETQSDTISGSFFKRPNNWKIQINSKYNPQYTAGGDLGIIDGIHGDVNWRKGEWQGYQGQDFEAVIDLGKEQPISLFSTEFLQDSRSWILMPTKVEFYTSIDNKNFNLVVSIDNTIKPDDNNSQVKKFNSTLSKSVTSRFVKVKAFNFGKLPVGHQGAGEDAFIFVDEIIIE
ncbi:MAG: alpha-mannosidase [Bacteroidetes bacterium RIFCSPLOWO2_12_FULL_35_15]|nr:MAG: alpha-mannosidase [Bacteroidetes bacterium RIFCSPLOWO2_12_FULL_35_15]